VFDEIGADRTAFLQRQPFGTGLKHVRCFVYEWARYLRPERAFVNPRKIIQHIRTIIPAAKRDVDKAKSCVFSVTSTTAYESRIVR
jgi:hypothetical protein